MVECRARRNDQKMSPAILLLVLLAGSVDTQLNTPQPPPPFQGASFGNCDSFSLSRLSYLVSLQLQAEAQRVNPDDGNLLVHAFIHRGMITCSAFGTEVGKFSSVSVAIEYSCGGKLCHLQRTERALAQVSFKCGNDNEWTIYGEDEPEFNTANHNPNFKTTVGVVVSPPGSCSACFNVARARTNRPGIKNVTTQCLGESSSTKFNGASKAPV